MRTYFENSSASRLIKRNCHVSEKVEEADLSTRFVNYLYQNRGEWWFCDNDNPKDRFQLSEETIGPAGQFLKINSVIEANVFDEKIIGLRIPIKVDLLVKEAPPAVKGNTAQGGNKQITLETGAVLNAPMFINEGDMVRINTEIGAYVERVDKK
jgi:elongation factor P